MCSFEMEMCFPFGRGEDRDRELLGECTPVRKKNQ